MDLVNVDYIPNKELQILELVKGIGSGLELGAAYDEAVNALKAQGEKLKADGIINVRIECIGTSEVGTKQVIAYGTAVKYRICYELQQF